MVRIPFFKRLLSYIYSIKVDESEGDKGAKLYLYRNQFVLSTDETTYSNGHKYQPAIAIANDLKTFLPSVNNVLVLGTGLGSIVSVFHRSGFHPNFTLVEKDKTILQWATEIFEADRVAGIQPVYADALGYMEQNHEKYDLIFVDIFDSRVVPDFVTSKHFLKLCYKSLTPSGHFVVNYMINDQSAWEKVKQLFTDVFRNHRVLKFGENRILVV